MKNIFLILIVAATFASCNSGSGKKNLGPGQHMAIIQEVLQTSQYTYLRVKEDEKESWLALPKMEAAVGSTYYYKDGLKMTDFVSKELNKTFPEVIFLDKITTTPVENEKATAATAAVTPSPEPAQPEAAPAGERTQVDSHVLVAEEVLQTTQYTYLHGKEAGKDLWVAVKRMDASVGTKYYFIGGLPMTNFKSKELKRTFGEILFADNISTKLQTSDPNAPVVTHSNKAVSTVSAMPVDKQDVTVKKGKTDLTIAQLMEKKNGGIAMRSLKMTFPQGKNY